MRAQCTHSATIWASGNIGDPYFEIVGMGMDLLVPEMISLILKLGAIMVLIKAGFMSLCHSLEERMALRQPANNLALRQPANNLTMTCTVGIGHALSNYLLACGIGAWFGTCGVAVPMSCTGQSVFCCRKGSYAKISLHF